MIADKDAFSNDFDACMINRWTATTGVGVLRTSPTASCNSRQHAKLCYGIAARRPDNAQFISCYNTAKLIPEFTAYVVPYTAVPLTYRPNIKFRQDAGIFSRYQHRCKWCQERVSR